MLDKNYDFAVLEMSVIGVGKNTEPFVPLYDQDSRNAHRHEHYFFSPPLQYPKLPSRWVRAWNWFLRLFGKGKIWVVLSEDEFEKMVRDRPTIEKVHVTMPIKMATHILQIDTHTTKTVKIINSNECDSCWNYIKTHKVGCVQCKTSEGQAEQKKYRIKNRNLFKF